MSREIRGRHILGGIALAALVSLPVDAMIVSGMLTEIRMERAFRAADARAADRAHDRAIADTVSAAPQPDQSALISRAQAEEETEESSPAVGGAVVSREGGTTKASVQKAINRAADLASISANKSPASAGLVNAGRDMGAKRPCHPCVTLGRDRGFARVSSGSGERPMPRTQGVRPERSVSVKHPEQEAADTGRSPSLYEVTSYSHGCTLPTSGRETHAQRAANGRWPIADVTVAADTTLHPFGTEVLIEGLGFRTVGDRGSAIKGRRLDLFVDSCREARAFGRRFLRVFPVPAATTREARHFDMETR